MRSALSFSAAAAVRRACAARSRPTRPARRSSTSAIARRAASRTMRASRRSTARTAAFDRATPCTRVRVASAFYTRHVARDTWHGAHKKQSKTKNKWP
jgi:hypothetical protein